MGIRIINSAVPGVPRVVEVFDPFNGKRLATGKLAPHAGASDAHSKGRRSGTNRPSEASGSAAKP